jgi:hypothetical protein
MWGVNMRKLRIINVLLLVVLILNLASFTMTFAANNDIRVKVTKQHETDVSKGKSFNLDIECEIISGDELNNIFVSVDKSSSFYIAKDKDQIMKLEEWEEDDTKDVTLSLVYKGTGNELTLIFDYEKEGSTDKLQFVQTLYLDVKEKNDQSSSNTQTDTSQYKPNFRILNEVVTKYEASSRKMSVDVPVKNVSSFSAKDIQITMSSNTENSPFSAYGGYISIPIDEIKPDKEQKIHFELAVNPTAKKGTYPITLKFQYSNLYGDLFTSEETVYVKVEDDEKTPGLNLKGVKIMPEKPVPGDKFSASFELENIGTLEARDVKVSLKGFSNEGITPELTGVKYIDSINGGKTGKISYNLFVSDKISVSSFPIEITVDYKDEFGNSYSENFVYYVPIMKKAQERASLVIDNISVASGSVSVEEDFKIGFDIINGGSAKASNIKVSVSNDQSIICKSQSIIMVDSMDKGENKRLEFTFNALRDAVTKNYPIAVNVEYEDDSMDGKGEKQTITQYVGVYVENSKTGESGSTPRIIIDRYGISTGQATAGQTFEIVLGILNTHKSIDVGNIGISFLADEGVFLPAAESTSTVFIDQIKAGNRVEKKISFVTKFDAVPKSYVLNINFEYEDDKQKQYTLKESISIPVVQENRLEISEIQSGPEAFIGMSVPVTLNFYNMGKSTLNNLMVKCKGDFDVQPGSDYFVGNFEPGRSDYYEAYVIPTKEGQLKGSVVFTFEDSMGKVIEVEKEFDVMVQGQPGMTMGEDPMMNPFINDKMGMEVVEKGFHFSILLIPVVLLVIIVAVIVLIVVIRKRRKARADLYENY